MNLFDIHSVYIWFLIFLAGIFILVKAADYFNKSAENIGLSFGMSPFIIGILLTAIGTSLPELITSVLAVLSGSSEIVAGNVTGSNISNILLIIGIVAVVNRLPIKMHAEFINVDLQFLIGSTIFATICLVDGKFTMFEGILSLTAFLVYFIYLVRSTKFSRIESRMQAKEKKAGFRDYLQFVFSGFLIYIAAQIVIESIVFVSGYYRIGAGIVAAGALALGTSLPELVVSLDAVKKGNVDYAIGNILGSSIFNSFLVLGYSSLFGQLKVETEVISIALPFMVVATFLFYLMTRDKTVTQWEGYLYILIYILFISKLLSTI